jgi:hypothetical protein
MDSSMLLDCSNYTAMSRFLATANQLNAYNICHECLQVREVIELCVTRIFDRFFKAVANAAQKGPCRARGFLQDVVSSDGRNQLCIASGDSENRSKRRKQLL